MLSCRLMKAIVRVSFQTDTTSNRAVSSVLIGGPQGRHHGGPFEKCATATFVNVDDDPQRVLAAVAKVLEIVKDSSETLDFLSITIVKPDKE